MQRTQRNSVCAFVFLTFIFVLGAAAPVHSADSESDYSQELAEVRSQIKQLKQDTVEFEQQRQTIEKDVANLESRLAAIETKRQELQQDIDQHKQDEQDLESKKEQQISDLEKESELLQELIRVSFVISRLDYVKILLSENNPSRLSRTVAYYRYLTRERVRRLDMLQVMGEELEETESRLQLVRNTLDNLSNELISEHEKLHELRDDLGKTIAHFDEQLQSNQEKLEKMEEEESRLLSLLESLQNNDFQPTSGAGESLSSMKGKLSLPLDAKIRARYGERKRIRGAYWQGLWLASSRGQDVHSIFTGQVVYSSHFDGFGVLVIVDHGENYMSLYAYNQEAAVQVGDWVDTQQIIASASATNTSQTSGFYFELRHNGSPVDPLLWCQL